MHERHDALDKREMCRWRCGRRQGRVLSGGWN
jgi:hypothetical protein